MKKAAIKVGFAYLLLEKEGKKKMKDLEYKELKTQSYLTSLISTRKQKLIFKWRTRMTKVGSNLGQTNPCPTCEFYVSLDSQIHLFNCEKLNTSNDNIQYEDIYSNDMTKVSAYADKIDKLLRKREIILKEKEDKQVS